MLSQENLQLWSSMLETAQRDRVKHGLERDPEVDAQIEIWQKELEKYENEELA